MIARPALCGVPLRRRKGNPLGCNFVDLALVGRDGRFIRQLSWRS